MIRRLWTEAEPFDFHGTYVDLTGAFGNPKPVQRPHPPILIGGRSAATLRVVAEHADLWNIPGGDIDDVVGRSALLDRYCAEIGRDPASITRSIHLPVSYDEPGRTRDAIGAADRRRLRAHRPRPARALPGRRRPLGRRRAHHQVGLNRTLDAGLGSPAVKVREEECRVPAPDCEIRSVVISPVAEGPRPGILLYTDIFQLTESTLRTARRIAVGRVRGLRAGDLPARRAGRASRWSSTTPASRPAWRARPARRPGSSTPTGSRCWTSSSGVPTSTSCSRSGSASAATWPSGPRSTRGSPRRCASTRPGCTTARWAPTTPDSLARAGDIGGRLMVVFGSRDPHVPADARVQHRLGAVRGRADGPRTARLRGRRARVHARRRAPGTIRC